MGVSTKFEPIDRDFLISLDDGTPNETLSEQLAAIAIVEREKAVAVNRQNGGSVVFKTVVDGVEGAAESSVKPDGVIVYEFDLIASALEWIGEALVKASPFLTGRYARSHILFADGREVAHINESPNASRYVFLNVQAYARKIEDGLSAQAPDGVYHGVAALAQSRFGNSARISYGWEYTAPLSPKATRAERREADAKRVPAIIVRTY